MFFSATPLFLMTRASIIHLLPHAASPPRPASLIVRFSVRAFRQESVQYPQPPRKLISSSRFDPVARQPRAKSSVLASPRAQLCQAPDQRESQPRRPAKPWLLVCSTARQRRLLFRLAPLRQ